MTITQTTLVSFDPNTEGALIAEFLSKNNGEWVPSSRTTTLESFVKSDTIWFEGGQVNDQR